MFLKKGTAVTIMSIRNYYEKGKFMSKLKNYLSYLSKGTDNVLLALCTLASVFGILTVYSATKHTMAEGQLLPRDTVVMIIAVVLGIVGALVISLVDYDIICKLWPLWMVIGLSLMIAVMIFGVAPSAREDARTWLHLGKIYFQPSELVKICFITTFAVHLAAVKDEMNNIKVLLSLIVHALVPAGLVAKSGDAGSALIFLIIAFGMLFVAGLNWKYILGAIVIVGAAIPLLWYKLSDFQKLRFVVIFNPEADPATAYQQRLGLSAISNGGLFGKGFFKGAYTQTGAVPESHNDMVFTVIGEELGLIGGLVAIGLIIAIIMRIVKVGGKAEAPAAAYICYGVATMIGIQAFVNLAMVLKIGPVIGITLPFFSAGGSSTLCLYIGIGLVLSVYRTTFNQEQETNVHLIGVRSPFDERYYNEVVGKKDPAAPLPKFSGMKSQNTEIQDIKNIKNLFKKKKDK